jgi:hypothetical protein
MSTLDPPALTITQRATAVRKAMAEAARIRADRQVNNALNQRNGFDIGAIIKSTLEQILRIKTLTLLLCTDSKSLYDCLVKLGTTQEKRLMVDLMCLRSYERREITEIKWIDRDNNPANAMTKSKPCQALRDLIDTNTVNLKATE